MKNKLFTSKLILDGIVVIYLTVTATLATSNGYTDDTLHLLTVFFIPLMCILGALHIARKHLRLAYQNKRPLKGVRLQKTIVSAIFMLAVIHLYLLAVNPAISIDKNVPYTFQGPPPETPGSACGRVDGWVNFSPLNSYGTNFQALQHTTDNCLYWRVDVITIALGVFALLIVIF